MRKFWYLLAATLLLSAFLLRTGSAASFPNGDINGDGKVNISDARLILLSAVGLRQVTSDERARADLNQDGRITVSDVIGALGIVVGTRPPAEALISYPDCLGLAQIYAAKDASLTKSKIPAYPSVTHTPGNLLSASGSFDVEGVDILAPPVTYGPFAVAAGGKLRARIVGTPPVPGGWSLGNWNSGLSIYFERYYNGTYTSVSERILRLAGQTTDNDLVGEATWPAAGRLTFVVTPPQGCGPLTCATWKQSYSVTVDILEFTPTSPAQAGMRLELGDRLTTGWNHALLSGQLGSLAQVGESSDVSVVAGDTIGIQPPPGLTIEPYEVQLARRLLELWLSGYPLPGVLEELMQQVFMDEGAFESNARRFLSSEFASGKLYEALLILNSEKDLYEAAVQVKLLLDGSKEKWTISKLTSALWEVKSPDGLDLLEWVVRLSGHAAEAVPVIGWTAAAMDAAQATALVREHYAQARLAAVQYGEASELFKASRNWSEDQVSTAIANLQQSIAQLEERIKINRAKLEFDLKNLEQQLRANMAANGPIDTVPYMIEAKKIANASNNELAALLAQVGGNKLKLEALQYRQKKPKLSGARFQQAQAVGRSARLVLNSGAVQVLGSNAARQDLQVDVLGYTAATTTGEFLCRRKGDSGYIGCISGEVLVRTPAGEIVKLASGKKLSVPSAQIEEFDSSKDALKPFEDLPLRDIITGAGRPAPYTDGQVLFENGALPEGWVWQDPNKDALLEFPEAGTVRITVPDGNDLWGARSGAPRLLRKVTGDFDFEADIKLQTAATDGASSEWLLFSPASYEGARAKQMDANSLAAHYRLFGGGILRWAGGTTFAEHQDFVRFKLTRRGDVWKSYWSLDGKVWHMSARETILLPDTLWVGWVFKRQAWDRMYNEKAVTTTKNVRLRTAPLGTLPVDEWDLETAEGAFIATEGKVVKIALDGTKLCSVYVHSGRAHNGDFDTVVRFSAKPWTYQAGQSYQFAVSARSASNDNTMAYIRRREFEDYAPSRYDTDLQINSRWGRYQWVSANDFSGYLRIARKDGKITTYYWTDGRWYPLGQFADRVLDPMYLTLWVSNSERASTPAPLSVEFEVVSDVEGAPISAWEPEDVNMPVLPPPADLILLPGTTAKLIQAPYPLGNLFFGPSGIGFVFSSENERLRSGSNVDWRGSLLMVTADGRAKTFVRSDVLCGLNRKGGAVYDGAFLVTVDYWTEGGNRYGGLFQLNLDGSFSEIALKEGHGGLSDLIPAAEGGWYFVDFENDNLWRLPKIGEPETRVITAGGVPYGLGVVAQDPTTGTLYCVNWKGSGWPFGGEDAIYKIVDGKAVLVAKAPEGQSFAGLDFARGGRFGTSLHASTGKQIVRVDEDGTLTPVISGGKAMGSMRFNPLTGDLLVVYGENQLLLVYGRG